MMQAIILLSNWRVQRYLPYFINLYLKIILKKISSFTVVLALVYIVLNCRCTHDFVTLLLWYYHNCEKLQEDADNAATIAVPETSNCNIVAARTVVDNNLNLACISKKLTQLSFDCNIFNCMHQAQKLLEANGP